MPLESFDGLSNVCGKDYEKTNGIEEERGLEGWREAKEIRRKKPEGQNDGFSLSLSPGQSLRGRQGRKIAERIGKPGNPDEGHPNACGRERRQKQAKAKTRSQPLMLFYFC